MDNKIFIIDHDDLKLNNISNILDNINKTQAESSDDMTDSEIKTQENNNEILVETNNNSQLATNVFSNINEEINIDIENIKISPRMKRKGSNNKFSKNNRITEMISSHLDSSDISPNNSSDNGWDKDAKKTLINWYELFKYDSFVYQFILDYNIKISNYLNILSIVASTILGIFSGFKLWIDDAMFQTISSILLMLFNFIVALITALSKRYIDEKRNETLRTYICLVDEFLGEISAQALKTPNYRINADTFFKDYNDRYTKIITSAPNLTIEEIKISKQAYKLYINETIN